MRLINESGEIANITIYELLLHFENIKNNLQFGHSQVGTYS